MQSRPASAPLLRIGTRGSPLALAQARTVQARLAAATGEDVARLPIVVIRTSGDAIQDRALADAGGKGLFTKEIEEQLLRGDIDIAVHSAKDVPTFLPAGLALGACLPREDARDALICKNAPTLAALPQGARIGTASQRRRAMLLRQRPDLSVTLLRGNVETRLRRIDEGAFDATLLALAGLNRLGLAAHARQVLAAEEFIPAVGQGVVTIEQRADDASARALLARIDDAAASAALAAERAFLAVLDGSCRTAIGGHAVIADGRVSFSGIVLTGDGTEAHETRATGAAADAVALAEDAGRLLLSRASPALLAEIRA